MEINEAIALIKHKNLSGQSPVTWADLGSGSGTFTYALAHLLPAESHIYAVDKSAMPLQPLSNANRVQIQQLQLDFVSQLLPFIDLDGILMANSLHYVRDKNALISKLSGYLKPNGRLLLVEYDTDIPNPWVPYPIRYDALSKLFNPLGYASIIKLQERPSLYRRANLYAALITR